MNEFGYEILVQAGLTGHKQAKYVLHASGGRDCALGVLHLTMHATRNEMWQCYMTKNMSRCVEAVREKFMLTIDEERTIVRLNDDAGLDFIGIARKLETMAASTPTEEGADHE